MTATFLPLPTLSKRNYITPALAGVSGLLVLLFSLPYIALFVTSLQPSFAQGAVLSTVFPSWAYHSLVLCFGVAPLALLLGVVPAWLVTRGNVKNRFLFDIALVLPLAMPAYIFAYAITNAWQFIIPNIRSLPVAIIILALATYPYVYVMARSAFRRIPAQTLDAAASLGRAELKIFWQIALPLARPAIAVGLALSLMEVLTDYGTSSFFGLNTIATGVLFAWTNHADPALASRLAVCLLCIALLLVGVEAWGRRRSAVNLPRAVDYANKLCCINRRNIILASVVCALPPVLGLLLPVALLVPDAIRYADFGASIGLAFNSLALGCMVAISCLCVAAVAQFTMRANWLRLTLSFGYAMPGVIVALAMLSVFAWLQNTTDIIFIGSVLGLVMCLTFRFTSLPLRAMDAAFAQIPKHYSEAASVLGANRLRIFWQILRPLLQPAALGAALLVLVDTLKELPATMLLRPFNWDTLAVHANALAMDERLAQAAFPALLLVVLAVPLLACALHFTWKEDCNDHEPDFSI